MKAHTASLINAIVLIALSGWGYLTSESPSFTAMIPAIFGVLLIACYPGVKAENKIVAHLAAVLLLVLVVALFTPLKGALGRDDTAAAVRVGVMLLATVFALAMFIKSFIDVRRARAAAEQDTG